MYAECFSPRDIIRTHEKIIAYAQPSSCCDGETVTSVHCDLVSDSFCHSCDYISVTLLGITVQKVCDTVLVALMNQERPCRSVQRKE